MKTKTVSYFMLFLATVAFGTFAVADSPITNGLMLHLEADAITGIGDGAAITDWPATVGNDATIAGNNAPIFVADVGNAMPGVNFDDGFINFDRMTNIRTIFWVLYEDWDALHDGFMLGDSSAYHFHRSSDPNYMWHSTHTHANIKNGVTSINGSAVNGETTDVPTSLSIVSVVTTGNVIARSFSKDRGTVGSRHWDGVLAELLVFDRVLVAGEESEVGLYLSAKYGLTTNYTDPGPYTVFMSPSGGNVDPGVTFTWSGNNGTGLTYELYIDTDTSFDGITPVVTTDTSYATLLLMNTTYYCRVDIQGGNQGTVQSFTTDGLTDTPAPGDGATRIEANLAELTWRDVNVTGASYDVFFGKTNPPAFAGTVTEAIYPIVAEIDPNDVYYWSVDTVANSETVSSAVWSFTTGGKAVNPTPAVGDIGISTRPLLSWQGDRTDTYIEEYDVYIGKTDPPAYAGTVTETSYTPDADIDPNDVYYWQVIAKRGGEQIVGSQPVWSFNTGLLVGYWPFDDNLTDIDGGNDASRAITQFAPGFIDESPAADFAGAFADDPITVPILNAVGATANWTISFWEYSYAGGSGWESIIGNGSDGNGWNTFEGGRMDGRYYVLGLAGWNYQYSPNDDSFLREGWHFHVVSNNRLAGTAHWYIDSRLIATYGGTYMTLAPDLYIGNVKGLSQPYNGKVDDLKLYSRPLTGEQVLQAYIDGVNGAPINPVPASGLGDIPWDTTLEWALVEVPIGITIEVGKEADLSDATPIELAADATSFNTLTGLGVKLDVSTGYFWRVTATYSDKTSPSPIWFFTVRDLLGDLSGNLVVGPEDVSLMSAEWLDDSLEYVASGEEFIFVDQEAWGVDPNLEDYDAYVTPGGDWGTSIFSVKTDPTPETDPESTYTPPSQTLLFTAWGDSGQQHIGGIVFPDSVDFNQFDSFGFWVYQTGRGSNFIVRPIDMNGAQPFNKTVWGETEFNDQWYRYEWVIGGTAASNIRKFDIWFGDNEFTVEFGNWFLVKDGEEVAVCLGKNQIAEDLNGDCSVNLLDAAVMGGDWMLDASNP